MSVVLPPEEYGREPGPSRAAVAEKLARRPPPKKSKQQTPQEIIDEFWDKFTTKTPGKATTVIPHNKYIQKAVDSRLQHPHGQTTQASYEEAAAVCKAKVSKIVKECRRINQKYRDPHFDLEQDLNGGKNDTLESLGNDRDRGSGRRGGVTREESRFRPRSVKRVVEIFDEPRFYIDGPTADDVRQGRDGDCWLLAALCTISNKPGLIERVCVARDEQVGVYGFVFHRDGEWISAIIDDKLFLTKPDFDESFLERLLWEDRERVNSEEQYRRAYQSGSGALYFAQCEHADETWLPLLEKAYAKAHGDYAAIDGGFTGEGIEDLTGGVTSELYSADILDREHFWKEELMRVNDEFLFGCHTDMWGTGYRGDRNGIVELHAYSVMRAVEMDGQRLVLLKNPWGKFEWKGPWSDGSKEWTAEWLIKLNHRFGDDGAFWISYQDLLRKYQVFNRTRLFGPDWKVTSLWTTVSVPWTLDYLDTYFAFTLARGGPVVLVLSQLDDRYYRGLEGQYEFELNFRLHRAGKEGYVVRTVSRYCQRRSINVELDLDAGEYTVLLKINAERDRDVLPVEEVVRANARARRDKLVAVGMSYDLAHSKGRVTETAEEKRARKEAEKRRHERQRRRLKKVVMKERHDDHYIAVKRRKKELKREARAKARAMAKVKEEMAERAEMAAREAALSRRASRGRQSPEVEAGISRKDGAAESPAKEAKEEIKKADAVGETTAKSESETQTHVSESSEKSKSEVPPTDTADTSSSSPGTKTPSASSNDSGGDAPQGSENEANPKPKESSEEPAEAPKSVEEVESQSKEGEGEEKGEIKGDIKPSDEKASHEERRGGDPDKAPGEDTGEGRGAEIPKHDSSPERERTQDRKTSAGPASRGRRESGGSDAQTGNKPRGYKQERANSFAKSHAGPGPDSDLDISSVSEISDRELDLELEQMALNARRRPPSPQRMAAPASAGPPPRAEEDSPDEFESDPWNAVATVGLRVYYKVPAVAGENQNQDDGEADIVKLRVVRPNPYLSKYDSSSDEDSSSSGGSDGEDGDDEKEKLTGENPADQEKAPDGDKDKGDKADGEGDSRGEKEARKEDEPVSSQGLDVDDSSKDATLVGDQEQRRKSILSTQIPPTSGS